MSAPKNGPTRSRAEARAKQLELRDSLRAWWEELAARRRKLKAKQAKARKAKSPSRGVDRVPKQYRVRRPAPVLLVEHTDAPRRDRRRAHLNTGRRMATSSNQPHVNPRRDGKGLRSGRLRKELVPAVVAKQAIVDAISSEVSR